MNIFTSLKRKTTQSLVSGFLILSVLTGILSACTIPVVTPTPTNEVGAEFTSSQDGLAAQELNLSSPIEMATEIVLADDTIQIDLNRAICSPPSIVKENFEKGEYDSGLETIKQWVGVWEKMGVFEGLEIENNNLSPVPLEGKAKVVCVDTRKKGGYSGEMFCPPFDLINGGLKAVPEEGKGDETDKPLQIVFEGTEKLVTKGSGNELVYQFMDKYKDRYTRYFDSKTGQIVQGMTVVSDIEVVENEIVIEGSTGVSSEILLDGNLAINKEAGDKYYRDFVDSLAKNEQNKDYMEGLLGTNPNGTKLLDYLKKNDYTLPPGLNLPYAIGAYQARLGDRPINEPIKLDTLKIVVYGSMEWKTNLGGVKEYISSLKTYAGIWTSSTSIQCFGWGIDSKDNRLVMVAGAKNVASETAKYPWTEMMTIGGTDGNFDFDRDSLVASGELIQINRLLKAYKPYGGNTFTSVHVFGGSCELQQVTSGVCLPDISAFFGQGKTLFEPAK